MPASLASQVVNKCLRITDRDNVTILVSSHVIPLAEEIAVECFKNGADAVLNLYTDKYQSAYLNLLSEESLRQPSVFCRAFTESSTAEIFLLAAFDPSIYRKTPPEKMTANNEGETKAHWPLFRDRKVRALSIGLPMLTRPRAKTYGFKFSAWTKMVKAASNVDYDRLAARGRKLRDALSDAGTIRITAKGTDLTFDVTGRTRRISDGVIDDEDISVYNLEDSLPAGSISVCPLEESAKGTIQFNVPTPVEGLSVKNVRLKFEDGKVVEFEGGSGSKRIKEEWQQAGGDKDRIANFTIGFNPLALTGYLSNDIAAGAVSVGIGSNEGVGGNNKSPFYFGGTLTGATVEAGGKTIVKAGKLLIP